MTYARTLRRWLLMPLVWRYVSMPGRGCPFNQAELSEAEQEIERRCRAYIGLLADQIGERHKDVPAKLEQTREFIAYTLEASGYTMFQHRFADGMNLIAELPGQSPETLVIGAHFDTVPGSPGANDNASGLSALLEMARLLRGKRFRRSIRFVAFDNEEHKGQPATAMGSHIYAAQCRQKGEKIVGMWSLETLGFFCSDAESQRYPAPLDLFYPTTGDFVAFVGNVESSKFVRSSVRAFRNCAAFPAEGVAAPQKFADINRSDQWGFWQAGYPALMVTDTANFRYPYYHSSQDTADKVQYKQLARLIRVLADTASALADSKV